MARRSFFTFAWSALLLSVALVGCGGPPPPTGKPIDPDLDRSNSAARSAFDRGSLTEAASLYEQSLVRARTKDSPRDVADAAYNLAACLTVLKDFERARALLHEAEWELGRIGGNADDVLLLEAKVARRQGKTAEALALTDRMVSRQHPNWKSGPPVGVYVLRGRLALDRQDVAAAKTELAYARAAFNDGTDPPTLAGITGLSAQIALAEKRPADAAAQFDSQIVLLQNAALYPDMGWALGHAGDAYLAAGRPDMAADRLYRAARCEFSLGNFEQARKFLDSASEAADAANAATISDLIRGLRNEMSSATTRPSATTLPSLPTEGAAPQ